MLLESIIAFGSVGIVFLAFATGIASFAKENWEHLGREGFFPMGRSGYIVVAIIFAIISIYCLGFTFFLIVTSVAPT